MTTFLDAGDARLTSYALGELDNSEQIEVERLLAASPELQAEVEAIRELAGMLRTDLAGEPVVELTGDQRRKLMSAAASPAPVTIVTPVVSPMPARRSRLWVILAPASATVVIGLTAIQLRTTAPLLHEPTPGTWAVHDPRNLNDLSLAVSDRESRYASELMDEAEVRELNRSKSIGLVVISDGDKLDGLVVSNGTSPELPMPVPALRFAVPEGRTLSGYDGESKAESKPASSSGKAQQWSDFRSYNGKPAVSLSVNVNSQTDPNAVVGLAGTFDDINGPQPKGYYFESQERNEKYEAISENAFTTPVQQPLSTFSIDVDSASYTNVRRFLLQGTLPPPNAVRIEEMVNYFSYSYPQPKNGEPFSVTADAAPCPWRRENYLARIALQARSVDKAKRPPTNLVFLLDVSGSMQAANKLPLVKQTMTLLCEELNERDRIAIVTYAGDAGVKLPSTAGSNQSQIMQVIDSLQAGGSTNGAAGINVAYELALQNFNGEGENRVILCTDGDFNVGVSDDDQLVTLIQQHARSKVFLSVFGFGMGNLKDAKLEKLADKGNGHYGYIDDLREARRVFSEELMGTLYTVAKDVKIQVEFNPLTVGAYRLIGYENRALAAKDFNDDTKDAGEIGAGHTVTALYEIIPRGQWQKSREVDPLKYAASKETPPVTEPNKANIPADAADDLFTVKLRYKQPTADTSVRTLDYVVDDIAGKNVAPSGDLQWAATVAAFGMQLRHSQFTGRWTLKDVYEAAQGARGTDANGRRREFLDLVQAAMRLAPESRNP